MSDTSVDTRCKSLNRVGEPCRNPVVLASGFCVVHDAESALHKQFMPGDEHTVSPGRKPRPKGDEVMRELVERQIEKIAAVFFDSLDASWGDDGAPAYNLRMQAARELLDRAYGKPKQVSEVAHSGGITLEQLLVPTPLAKTNTPLPEEDE